MATGGPKDPCDTTRSEGSTVAGDVNAALPAGLGGLGMFKRSRLVAAALFLALPSLARADTVEVVPNAPLPGEPFFIRIFGTTPSSFTPFIPYRTELVGTEIQIEGCISGSGFAVPGFYWRSIPVTGLPPENYTVSVYRAICRDFKEPVVPWTFAGSTTFSVSDANANLPNDGTRIRMWEYQNLETGDFFLTGDEREMAALETGRIPGWAPRYNSFELDATAGDPMCRFLGTGFPGKAPHFYTSRPEECAAVKANPAWVFEGIVGHATQPSADSECLGGIPLYRAYNNGKFGSPGHRYRARNPLLDMVLYDGWVDEGVVACLPPPSTDAR